MFFVGLGVFKCHFLLILGAKCYLGMVVGASKNDSIKKWNKFKNLRKCVGGGYINLWSVAVLGHDASRSLVLRKGHRDRAGNWSRPALEAR